MKAKEINFNFPLLLLASHCLPYCSLLMRSCHILTSSGGLVQIIRDTSGIPEVLTRLDQTPSPMEDAISDYES